MTDEQAEGLRRLAALRQKSQAALLRDALDRLLDDEERDRRTEMALEVIDRYRGSPSDEDRTNVAENHDAALEEAYLS